MTQPGGKVYLVGAGPGDPGLLTLKGARLVSEAEVIVYDRLISPQILGSLPASAERVYVGKSPQAHTLRQEQINALLVDRAKAGKIVVRLKGGDPFVFGRGGEEALALAEAGIPFEIVPGVTAAIAAAATSGIPVTHRGLASQVAFITGHEDPTKPGSDLDWDLLARWRGTLAFYMGLEQLPAISGELIRNGMDPQTPAAAIQEAATPRQRTVTATLGRIAEAAGKAGLVPPTLVIVGVAVRLREALQWFESRPLFGKRILNTRPKARAHDLTGPLSELGAEVLEVPTIRIEPLRDAAPLRSAIESLSRFDWVVFTSAEGVSGFFEVLSSMERDARALAGIRICVIGPGTGRRLQDFGIRPDLMPERFTSDSIAEALPLQESLQGKRILCPRADIAPERLVESLSEKGAEVVAVPAYHVVSQDFDVQAVQEEISARGLHWITFTSPSTAESFLRQIPCSFLKDHMVKIASIGPVTSRALKALGLEPDLEADPHTMEGMVAGILQAEAVR